MATSHPLILILIIDDDKSIRNYLRATLNAFSYHVEEASTGALGLELARALNPDLLLLDLGLPDMDGLDLSREVRSWSRVPIIIVSGRRGAEDMARALDSGADDYLSKPFGSKELLARIRFALCHAVDGHQPVLGGITVLGPLQVNFDSREVTVYGQDVHPSPNEFLLVTILLRHPGKVLTHQELLHGLPMLGSSPRSTSLLRVYMANMRRKLELDPARPRLLHTEPGVGYRLQEPPPGLVM